MNYRPISANPAARCKCGMVDLLSDWRPFLHRQILDFSGVSEKIFVVQSYILYFLVFFIMQHRETGSFFTYKKRFAFIKYCDITARGEGGSNDQKIQNIRLEYYESKNQKLFPYSYSTTDNLKPPHNELCKNNAVLKTSTTRTKNPPAASAATNLIFCKLYGKPPVKRRARAGQVCTVKYINHWWMRSEHKAALTTHLSPSWGSFLLRTQSQNCLTKRDTISPHHLQLQFLRTVPKTSAWGHCSFYCPQGHV